MMVELFVKGRFVEIKGAKVSSEGANVLRLSIPKNDVVKKLLKKPLCLDLFDDAVLAVDGVELAQVIGSGEDTDWVYVSGVQL